MSAVYKPKELGKEFEELVVQEFNTYNNINFFLERTKPYVRIGRIQTEQEAIELDKKVFEILQQNNIPFIQVKGNRASVDIITNHILEKLGISININQINEQIEAYEEKISKLRLERQKFCPHLNVEYSRSHTYYEYCERPEHFPASIYCKDCGLLVFDNEKRYNDPKIRELFRKFNN